MYALRVIRPFISLVAMVFLVECSGGADSHGALPTSKNVHRSHILSEGVGITPMYPDGTLAFVGALGDIYLFDGPITSNTTAPDQTITALHSSDGPGNAALTFDPSGNLWVAEDGPSIGVYEFAAPVTSGESPSIAITGSNTGLIHPDGISYNASTGNIYVSNFGGSNPSASQIDVWTSTSNGNVAPSATISGANTGLSNCPTTIKTDASFIYVGIGCSSGGIEQFHLTDSGNVTPLSTLLSGTDLNDFDFDVIGNIYFDRGAMMRYFPQFSQQTELSSGGVAVQLLAVGDNGFIYSSSGRTVSVWETPFPYTVSLTTDSLFSLVPEAMALYSPGKLAGNEPQ
jgi:hypothetical protein